VQARVGCQRMVLTACGWSCYMRHQILLLLLLLLLL
jgi:hypothetical protein